MKRMNIKNKTLKNFIVGGSGYALGAVAGLLFVIFASRVGLARWIVRWVSIDQPFLKMLWFFLVISALLAVSGALIGGLGGYAMQRILRMKSHWQPIVGSTVAYALTGPLITILILLFIIFGLYNNYSINQLHRYRYAFISGALAVYGLIFGALTGLLQGLMTVRLRHSWRLMLATALGFALGSAQLGLLVHWMNPTETSGPDTTVKGVVLAIGLIVLFFLSGGFLGIVHGKLRQRAEAKTPENPAGNILPIKQQTYLAGGVGLVIVLSVLGFLSTISSFRTINPAALEPYLQVEAVGVHWSEPIIYEGTVTQPMVETRHTITVNDVEHHAWCGDDGMVYYQAGNAAEEQILAPACSDLPALALDSQGQAHLIWYAQEIVDTTGNTRPVQALVESIRTQERWSDPAIVALTQGHTTPLLTQTSTGDLRLIWTDESGAAYTATQGVYQCDLDMLNPLERAGLNAVFATGLRDENSPPHFCYNQFMRLEFTPNPDPSFSDNPPTPNGAFDQIAALVNTAQYEVLFTTMKYEPDVFPPSPGTTLAAAVANLYRKVKAHPENYPRGMTVRILLGNYPELDTFIYGNQIINVISNLRDEGVETMLDPEIGWRVEVANFADTYPYSHTKFVVVDGKTAVSVGFNYGYMHLPKDHPSGKGHDMLDMGIQVRGPVVQDMIAAFDDMWDGADQIQCDDFYPDTKRDWTQTCRDLSAMAGHVPEVLRTYIPPEANSRFFSLYRSEKYLEGDTFIAAALGNAQESIDMIHVNFSLEMYCMLDLVLPNLCTSNDVLPWMEAIIQAVETNKTHVRAIVENTSSNGQENRIGAQTLMDELARRGYDGYVEIRFYNGKLHAKSTLIDNQLLIIGSQNMHYSSWGEGRGLTEHSLVTSDPEAIAEYQRLFEVKWAEASPFKDAEYSITP